MYYRLAMRPRTSPVWYWKSTVLTSLDAVFQLLRLYQALPRDRLLVCSAPSREHLNEMLRRANAGLESGAVTATQFLQERLLARIQGRTPAIISPSELSHIERKGRDAMTETMKRTGAEMSLLASREQCPVTITRRGLFRIEVYPCRRWRWWGKRGWLVVLYLLHEQGDTWRCRKFLTSFPDLCNRLGIDPDDPVWQARTPPSMVCSEPSHHAKDQGWMPFCMF